MLLNFLFCLKNTAFSSLSATSHPWVDFSNDQGIFLLLIFLEKKTYDVFCQYY